MTVSNTSPHGGDEVEVPAELSALRTYQPSETLAARVRHRAHAALRNQTAPVARRRTGRWRMPVKLRIAALWHLRAS